MAEVIDLLSSSPLQGPITVGRSSAQPGANRLSTTLVDFDFEDFDDTGDLSFHNEQPAKRRRLSPLPNGAWKAATDSKSPLPLDLSSEPELLKLPRQTEHASCSNAKSKDLLDDIVFSSSAPELRKQTKTIESIEPVFDLSSDSLPDDPFQLLRDDIVASSQPVTASTSRRVFSSKTETILADLTTSARVQKPSTVLRADEARETNSSTSSRKGNNKPSLDALVDDIIVSSPAKKTGKKVKRQLLDGRDILLAVDQKVDRAATQATKQAEKEAQKQAELDRKRREKEAKAKEKQIAADKAEVNKSKVNKNDTTSEMIVEMSATLQDTSVGNQVAEFMKELSVELSFVEEEVNLTSDDDVCHDIRSIVKWQRKVTSEYSKDIDEWIPVLRHRVQDEQHILVYLTAIDFVKIVAGHTTGGEKVTAMDEDVMKQNVDLYMTSFRSVNGVCVPILLIQGLDAWLKKGSNAKNREYTAAVRARARAEDDDANPQVQSSSQSKPRKRKKPAMPDIDLSFVTLEIVDELMLHLQLNHQPIIVQRSTSAATSASEITKFTQHLSTRPGRIAFQDFNMKSASFCMESGQVKTGDNAEETYVKMLQEVQRITPSMAYGIVAEYDSILKLVQGFRQSDNLMLEDVRKSTNKDGGWSDKRLGPMVSKRLYKIFMGRDPAATDGMS